MRGGLIVAGGLCLLYSGPFNDNSADRTVAVYFFVQSDEQWQRQAALDASNSGAGDDFGPLDPDLNANVNTLVVGARVENSSATGINGDRSNNSALCSGAVYMY